jgi:hypothetical protein
MDVYRLDIIIHQIRLERERVNAFLDGLEAEVAAMIPPDTGPKTGKQIAKEISAVLRRKRIRSVK